MSQTGSRTGIIFQVLLWFFWLILLQGSPLADSLPLEKIVLPEGFKIDIFARGVDGARSMAMGDGGTLFVGSRDEGNIYALPDKNGDLKADEVIIIARGLNMPNGVAFRGGSLYVAEVSRVIRFDEIESRLSAPPTPVSVNDSFPRKRHHGWKFIGFGPDGYLYVPVGAPCNVCERDDPRFATIMRMKPDGTGLEVFASGVRNSVGFDWHPKTKELWFTDNGRDWMGDDIPPDELNRAPGKGMHFGFPYCHGGNVEDPVFGKKRPCGEFTPPALKLQAHVAPLGMRFYRGKMFPERYRGQAFIAEHGSWNRSVPSGYKVQVVTIEHNRALSVSDFATGWLQNGRAWGRPVDILMHPDGSLFLSDDRAGVIYRITYEK